jgi:fused signal recognition particle receptor
MTWIYLVLIAVVVLFGVGVLLWNRRRGQAAGEAPKSPPPGRVDRPPRAPASAPTGTAVLEPDTAGEAEPEVAVAPEPEPATLRGRMSRARAALAGVFAGVRGRSAITDETWDELEEALLRADVGIGVTTDLLDGLRTQVKAKEITTPDQLIDALRDEMKGRLAGSDRTLRFDGEVAPNVWLFVGVNGVGKTTSIGKVASQQTQAGHTVLMAAGDTFRAAAAEQLTTWAQRAGVELVRGSEGGDPSAVVYDAVESAASKGVDLVLADTAGRLHTKTNLMEELTKVRRVISKQLEGAPHETLVVIDATTGQNGVRQAKEFQQAAEVTGAVLTKLDGSAKGGVALAIASELGIPVKLIGIGEALEDLRPFDPDQFALALLGE